MRHNIFDSIPSNIVSGKDNVFANFLQTAGLYKSMKIDEDNIEDLILLLDGKVRISTYCKECKEERVFTMKPYIYFQDKDNKCYSKKLSEEVLRTQKLYILKNTSTVGGHVEEQNTVWKWKESQIEEVASINVIITGVDGVMAQDYVEFEEGMSAYDALKILADNYEMDVKTSGLGQAVYVKGVNGLMEFDYGGQSGWKYKVNGAYPSLGAGAYILKDGDQVEWIYSTNG